MKTNPAILSTFIKRICAVMFTTATILLIALLLKLTTGSPEWTGLDFAVAGFMLFGTGLAYILVTRKRKDLTFRLAVGLACLTGLLLFWSNLAVGIIGSEDEAANLMYAGVLLVALIASILGRFQASGLAVAMFITAGAQALTVAVALLLGLHNLPESSAAEIILVNGFFIVLWVVSAFLFSRAAKLNRPSAGAEG